MANRVLLVAWGLACGPGESSVDLCEVLAYAARSLLTGACLQDIDSWQGPTVIMLELGMRPCDMQATCLCS
jgi:hypothetical protein